MRCGRVLPVLLALALAGLAAGCASTGNSRRQRIAGTYAAPERPPDPKVYRSVRPDNLPPESTFRPDSRTVHAAEVNRLRPAVAKSGAAPRPAAAVKLPPPPAIPEGPVSQEWRVSLTHGQRKATLNGVQIWLSEPATTTQPKKKGEKPRVSVTNADLRYTLGPLLYAPTNALVSAPRKVRVFLDPGHGGDDPGVKVGSRKESELTLDIVRRLAGYLKLCGYDVRVSRSNNRATLPLEDRPALASAWPADLFVSVHINSGPSAANGIETYAMPPVGHLSTDTAGHAVITAKDRADARKAELGNCNDAANIRLAWCVHRRLVAATGRADRGIRRARFAVLRDATMPAILVETGFLTNASEASALASAAGRDKIAIGLCRGIMDFAAGHISPIHPAIPIRPADGP
jgi:N-acetylmuramoyl-L-alanine amidase